MFIGLAVTNIYKNLLRARIFFMFPPFHIESDSYYKVHTYRRKYLYNIFVDIKAKMDMSDCPERNSQVRRNPP